MLKMCDLIQKYESNKLVIYTNTDIPWDTFNETAQVCGTCKHWQTCDSTEGWRINMPCTGISGVQWEAK